MNSDTRRYSFAEDCLLAGITSVIAYMFVLLFVKIFFWPALLALLIVPTILLSTYGRYRAAGMCSAVALIAGTWDVVPPSRSFDLDSIGIAAVATFAAATTVTIGMAAWLAKRHMATQTSH